MEFSTYFDLEEKVSYSNDKNIIAYWAPTGYGLWVKTFRGLSHLILKIILWYIIISKLQKKKMRHRDGIASPKPHKWLTSGRARLWPCLVWWLTSVLTHWAVPSPTLHALYIMVISQGQSILNDVDLWHVL